MNYLAYFMLGAMLLAIVLLAAPISLRYDSVEKWYKLRWLGLTITRRPGAAKPKKSRKITKKKRKPHGFALMGRLWRQRDLVAELINKVGRFVLEVFRTLSFRDSEAAVSLPDPMWTGVLYGVLTNVQLQNVNLWVNFENRNYAKIQVTVYPYRVAGKLLSLLIRLPYLHLLRFAWDLRKSS